MIGHVLLAVAGARAPPGRRRGGPPARAGRPPHPGADARRRPSPSRRSSRAPGTPYGSPSRPRGTTTGTVLVAAGDTPLLRGDSLRGFAAGAPGRRSAPSACSAASSTTRTATAGSSATTRATSRGSSRRRTRPPSSARSARSAPGSSPSTPSSSLEALPRLGNDNAKGEYYLTDVVGLAREAGLAVGAFPLDDVHADRGCQRPGPARPPRPRAQPPDRRGAGCATGVTVMDPATTWVDAA